MTKIFRIALALSLVLTTSLAPAQTEQVLKGFSGPNPTSRGVFKVYIVANPAAGANFAATVPTGKIWRVVSLRLQLTNDATVINRFVQITITDGTNQLARIDSNAAATAGNTAQYNANPCTSLDGVRNGTYMIPLPCNAYYGPGYVISSLVANLQAADQLSTIVFFVQEWNSGNGN